MKGLFIPDITAEMFKNGCLEGIEALMAEGEIYDIDYTGWIPVSEGLPEVNTTVLTCDTDGEIQLDYVIKFGDGSLDFCQNVAYGDCSIEAWQLLPAPYKESDKE